MEISVQLYLGFSVQSSKLLQVCSCGAPQELAEVCALERTCRLAARRTGVRLAELTESERASVREAYLRDRATTFP